ncbi:MAG: NAD(P)-dependent oxidoreductase, partial [Pyrinomonadaceae bacterium]|nr:NAD(P)-dependent oxidoreductase [Pyrinomonadaceae bacterium]
AWSLLGAYDWNTLLTRMSNHYEPGVFDVRSRVPRPTALARMLKDMADGQEHNHPVLSTHGWWRRLSRLAYPPVRRVGKQSTRRARETEISMSAGMSVPILITGARGTLGRAFARLCDERGLAYRLLTREQLDIADSTSVEAALNRYEPWALINAAGFVRVDDAEYERERCFRENTVGAENLAAHCARSSVKLLTFSSDLVFDGRKSSPYLESDAVCPLNVYGQSKAEAEARVLRLSPAALVVRTSAFFGPWDEYNFVTAALRTLSAGQVFVAAGNSVVSPTYVPDLVHACLDLLIDDEQGLWHLANDGAITWAELARRAATLAGLDASGVEERASAELNLAVQRPAYSVLASERATLLPALEDALLRYLRDVEGKWTKKAQASMASFLRT